MFDVEKLIASIREYPALWDITHVDSSKKMVKDRIWNDIAEGILPKWVEMTAAEKEEKLKEIKKKWRYIRASYGSSVNHNRLNPDNKKHYYYADDLGFLDNHIILRRARRDDDNEEEKEEKDEEDVKIDIEEEKVFDQIVLDPDNGCNKDDPLQQIATPPSRESPETVTSSSMQQQPSIRQKVISENQTQQPRNLRKRKVQGSSADRAFLLSILPDYGKLSYAQKLEFRMYALGFFKRVNDEIVPFNGKH